jgi:hypothetical protein
MKKKKLVLDGFEYFVESGFKASNQGVAKVNG